MTKKNIIIASVGGIITIAVIVLCLVCCGGKKNSYCSVIPQDAISLVKVDGASFLHKHDIDLTPLISFFGGEDAAKQLQNCGIDYVKPVYLFYTDKSMAGAALAVNDQEALISTLNNYASLLGGKVTKKQNYNWMELNDIIIVFDDTKLLALSGGGMNARKTMLNLMKQDEDESVMATTMFENLGKVEKPFAVVMSTTNMAEAELTQLAASLNATAEEVQMDAVLGFDIEKDKAILSLDINPLNDKCKAKLETYSALYNPIAGKLLEKGISNPAFWGSINVKGDKLWDAICGMSEIKRMAEDLPLDKILPSFNGDVTVVAPNLNGDILVMAEVKDKSALNVIKTIETLSEGNIKAVSVGPDAFCIGTGKEAIYMGIKDGIFYIASNQELSLMCGKDAETNIKEDDIKDAVLYATIDAQTLIGTFNKANSFDMFRQLALVRLQKLDKLTLRSENATHVELSLSVKDGKDFVTTMFK